VSDTSTEVGGTCLHCGDIGSESLTDHFDRAHAVRVHKPRVEILSWSDRISRVQEALEQIKTTEDPKTQVLLLDERVIKPLHLVRARLTETRRHQATGGS
jgi:hypothetical protein